MNHRLQFPIAVATVVFFLTAANGFAQPRRLAAPGNQTSQSYQASGFTARYLRPDEELPIPTPKPISPKDSSGPASPPSPQGPVPPGLSQPSPSGGLDQKPSPPPLNSPPLGEMPPPDGVLDQKPPPNMSPQSASPGLAGENDIVSLEFPLGENFSIRAYEQIGMTLRVFANRKDFVAVTGATLVGNSQDMTLSRPMESILVAGRKLGVVDLTLIGERGVKRFRLKILPSVELIQGLIARQFPQSNVRVAAAGDHVLILDGEVQTPSDAEAIMAIVQEFAGQRGKVLNGIKVTGVMQVQLEVVIARVDRSGIRRLGINFQLAGREGFGGNQIGGLGGITPIASAAANNAAGAGGNAFQSVGGAATSVVSPASTVFFGLTHELKQFMMQIEALQQQGVAKVLAKPTLVTLNGRPAEFLVGGEQPFPYQTSAITTPSVDFKKFGTRLNFVPVILGPDKIRLDLVPEVSSVNFTQAINVAGNQVPQFITQRIHTTVEMEPGQSLVLGGLLQTEDDAQVQKVPFLGDLPVAGAAFRRVRHDERELELIVVVTPRLVHPFNNSLCPVPVPGEESRRPTDKELFLHGLPEAPHEVYDGGFSSSQDGVIGLTSLGRNAPSAKVNHSVHVSSVANPVVKTPAYNVKPVGTPPVRTSRGWFNFFGKKQKP